MPFLQKREALIRLDPRQTVALAHEALTVCEQRRCEASSRVSLLDRAGVRDARPRLDQVVERGPRRVLFHAQAIATLFHHRIGVDAIAVGLRQLAVRALDALPLLRQLFGETAQRGGRSRCWV